MRSFLLSILLFFLLATNISGCVPKIKYGSAPRVSQLGRLEAGVSVKADILLALGEPRGYGKLRLSPKIDKRDIWFYEYAESKNQTIHIKYLIIFLFNEHYDGHLWISSFSLLEVED